MDLKYFKNDEYFDFFLSHNQNTTEQAEELYNIIRENYPDSKIFFDRATDEKGNHRFNESNDNDQYMKEATAISKILIFIAKEQADTFDGHGNMPKEIRYFNDWKSIRFTNGRSEYNIACFGIFLCEDIDWNNTNNIFESSSNHYLIGNRPISDCTKSLLDRIDSIIDGRKRFESDYASEILSKVEKWYSKKTDFFITNDYIQPTLQVNNSQKIDFDELCKKIQEENILIIGDEGGLGKTTLLKELFKYFLKSNSNLIPIWIEAKELCNNNNIFLRYIERELFNNNLLLSNSETNNITSRLNAIFRGNNDKAKSYLFIIDGLNELPNQEYEEIVEQLNTIINDYTACRFLVSTRGDFDDISSLFTRCKLMPLNDNKMYTYIKSFHIKDPTFKKILSIPMYLKLFLETSDETVSNKGMLLYRNFKTKYTKLFENQTDKGNKYLIIYNLLPFIAYNMVKDNIFHASREYISKCVEEFIELIQKNEYFSYYKTHGFGNLFDEGKKSFPYNALNTFLNLTNLKGGSLPFELYVENTLSFLTNSYRIFVDFNSENGKEFEFTHQIYRDFFCSFYIAESIKRYAENGCNIVFDIFKQKHFEKDIREFICDLFANEKKPCFNKDEDDWDYSCNDSSLLLAALDKTRNSSEKNAANLIGILIAILKSVRADDLTNIDLSQLDLSGSDLKALIFSRRYKNKIYATSFKNSKINTENLISENCYTNFAAACLNSEKIATIDRVGKLAIWERDKYSTTPIQTIEGLNYNIKKLRFSDDGLLLYAMTSKKILSIDYLNDGKVDKLFESTETLQNFQIEENEIYFTTVSNPFNIKSIKNPYAEDSINFRYITPIAAVNKNKNALFFADNNNFGGLKIYIKQGDDFIEKKWGYALYVEEFLLEIEDLFRTWGIYHIFPNDKTNQSARRSYFLNKQSEFEDRNHDYHIGISNLLAKITKYVHKKIPDFLTIEKEETLNKLCEKYVNKVKEFVSQNPEAIKINGRRILSIDINSDQKTLLLSTLLSYKKESSNTFINNWVLFEFNTETLECVELAFTTLNANEIIAAEYHGKEILSHSDQSIAGYGPKNERTGKRNIIRKMNTKDLNICRVIRPKNADLFYILAQNFIYEVDIKSGKILYAIPCSIRYNKKLVSFCREISTGSTGFKLCKKSKEEFFITIDGRIKSITSDDLQEELTVENEHSKTIIETENIQYKLIANKLVSYNDNRKIYEKPICYKLFVSGCDFSGVTGSLTEIPESKKTLMDYSAKADFEPTSNIELVESFCFNDNKFESNITSTINPSQKRSKFSYSEDIKIAEITENITSDLKKNLVNSSFSNHNFDDFDRFMLDWIFKLECVNANMLLRLTQAFLPQNPNDDPVLKVNEWINLFSKKLLLLNKYHIDFAIDNSFDFYTLSSKEENRVFLSKQLNQKNFLPKTISKPEKLLKKLAFNEWFTKFLKKHGSSSFEFQLSPFLNSEEYCFGLATVEAILKSQNSDYLIVFFRRNYTVEDVVNKIERVQMIASAHNKVYHICTEGFEKTNFNNKPIIVAFGEDYDHCIEIDSALKKRMSGSSVLYAYDCLGSNNITYDFIKFVDDKTIGIRFE